MCFPLYSPFYALRTLLFLLSWLLVGSLVSTVNGYANNAPIPCIGDVDRAQDLYVQPGEGIEHARERIAIEAMMGRVEAQRILALFYFCGTGGEQNEEKGMELLVDAAEKGSAWAQMDLGIHLQTLAQDSSEFELARFWYEKSANNPESSEYLRSAACLAAGSLYEHMPQENGLHLDKALAWYEKSDSPEGLFYSAMLYVRNQELPKSGENARAFLEEAAEKGVRQAFAQRATLALASQAGEGAYIDAFMWLNLALEVAWSGEKAPLEQELKNIREHMTRNAIVKGEKAATEWKTAHPQAFTQ